ncbi:hypothetical protein IWZ03DRAFT_202588 [Phyllosticta citriasiana]|uniref:Secreted protein n=1 Tax=Phyllosticta citriasiana TaxID=595635 RepID=A0ABR1KI64_9PEZI
MDERWISPLLRELVWLLVVLGTSNEKLADVTVRISFFSCLETARSMQCAEREIWQNRIFQMIKRAEAAAVRHVRTSVRTSVISSVRQLVG